MGDRIKTLMAKQEAVDELISSRTTPKIYIPGLQDMKMTTTPDYRAEVTQLYLEDKEFRDFVRNLAKVNIDDV